MVTTARDEVNSAATLAEPRQRRRTVPETTPDWALEYAAVRWSTFLLHYPIDAGCSCKKPECDRIGKHPMGHVCPNGLRDATTDKAQLCHWLKREPRANLAVRTSKADGIFMVGPDGDQGIREFADLQQLHGTLPLTPKAISGGGGQHFIFAWPGDLPIKNGRNVHGRKIDVRGENGYFVVCPSRHASGGFYDWLIPPWEVPPADAPDWLVTWIMYGDSMKPPERRAPAPSAIRARPTNDSVDQVIRRAVAYLAAHPPAISEQGGHPTTMSAARAVIWGFDLTPEIGYQILAEHYNPRCQPPWSEKELRHKCEDADKPDPLGRPRSYLRDEPPPAQPAPDKFDADLLTWLQRVTATARRNPAVRTALAELLTTAGDHT